MWVFLHALLWAVSVSCQDDHSFFSLDANDIGATNYAVTSGNPFRGLLPSPTFFNYDAEINNIDASLDFYFVPFSEIVKDDPSVVGEDDAYDWGPLEKRLDASAAKFRHAILTFSIHIPGQALHLPQYLMEDGILRLHSISSQLFGAQTTPDYGDPELMDAIERFIDVLGRKYDGDRRIAIIHLGLLGFWGEWHTFPENGFIPESSMERVAAAFQSAFETTKIQGRYPYEPAYKAKFGLFDASFAFNTLDGPPNGGTTVDWYFWPSVKRAKQTDFWRFAPMGGETRPELQPDVFRDSFPAGTFQHQDFDTAVRTTHASFMFHQDAWVAPGYTGDRLENALRAHTRLGYSFIVSRVVASTRTRDDSAILLEATVKQVGVAPFYYPLSLVLQCDSLTQPISLGGVDDLIDFGSIKVFTFTAVPSDSQCRSSIQLSLSSRHGYEQRPIKFAQSDGKVHIAVPDPEGRGPIATFAPATAPSEANIPKQLPASPTTVAPTTQLPVARPSSSTSTLPPTSTISSDAPSSSPTFAPAVCLTACRSSQCTSAMLPSCSCCGGKADIES